MITTSIQYVKHVSANTLGGSADCPEEFVSLAFTEKDALGRVCVFLPIESFPAAERFAREINAIVEKKDES